MLKAIWGLRSTNNNGIRTIYVKARNDSQPVTVKLDYLICDSKEEETVTLQSNEEVEVPHVHGKNGQCTVAVSETTSKLKTIKALDLDADESL